MEGIIRDVQNEVCFVAPAFRSIAKPVLADAIGCFNLKRRIFECFSRYDFQPCRIFGEQPSERQFHRVGPVRQDDHVASNEELPERMPPGRIRLQQKEQAVKAEVRFFVKDIAIGVVNDFYSIQGSGDNRYAASRDTAPQRDFRGNHGKRRIDRCRNRARNAASCRGNCKNPEEPVPAKPRRAILRGIGIF